MEDEGESKACGGHITAIKEKILATDTLYKGKSPKFGAALRKRAGGLAESSVRELGKLISN